MNTFFDKVLDVLRQDTRFFSENGELLRNAVYEAAMQMDAQLIKLLYSNEETQNRFFTDIDGVAVFDKVGFGWVVNNREFLKDSYTRYRNKIGLVDENSEYISQSGKVELVFPYKDCILEGGQTQEDQKRNEIFYNETLAPDEVDRLLAPKVFANAKRYSTNGVESATIISNMDITTLSKLRVENIVKESISNVKVRYEEDEWNNWTPSDFDEEELLAVYALDFIDYFSTRQDVIDEINANAKNDDTLKELYFEKYFSKYLVSSQSSNVLDISDEELPF